MRAYVCALWLTAAMLAAGCGDDVPSVKLRPRGLWTDPSPDDAPEGGMLDATNVVIRRRGLAEPRPGFSSRDLSGDVGAGDGVRGIFPFVNDDDKHHRILALEDAGEWSLASYRPGLTSPADLTEPWADATDAMVPGQIHAARASGSLFLTSAEGVLRWEDGGLNPVFAGLPQALQAYPTTQSNTPAWLESAVAAYRIVYKRDLGTRVILSAPSPRSLVAQGVGARSVSLLIDLHPSLVAGDVVQIYRSQQQSLSATSEPTDEMRLLAEITLTSGDVSTGSVTHDDHRDDAELQGAALYTNDTQESELRANRPVPIARDVALFQQMLFFGGATTKHRFTSDLALQTDNIGLGAEWPDAESYLTGSVVVGDTTSASNTITNVSAADITRVFVGMSITRADNNDPESADANFPAGTEVTGVGASSFTVSNNALASTVGLQIMARDWLSIDGVRVYLDGVATNAATKVVFAEEVGALAHVINQTFADIVAYEAGALPALQSGSRTLRIEHEDGTDVGFVVRTSKPSAFTAAIARTSDTSSEREGSANTLRWTKVDQPDHAPLIYQVRVGNSSPILRIVPTRASLLVFKSDGVWRVTGESPEALRLDEHDQTVSLLHPDLCVAMGNVVWAVTNKSVVAVSDGGVQSVSDPAIDATLAPFLATLRDAGVEAPGYWSVADEPNDEVIFGLDGTGGPENVYAFNAKTTTWVRWDLDDAIGSTESPVVQCGAYDDDTGTVVLGVENQGSVPYILESRDGVGTSGTFDQSFAETITVATDNGNGTSTLTIPGAFLQVGDAVSQSSRWLVVTSVSGSDFTGAHTASGFTAASCTCYRGFESVLRWRDESMGDDEINKHWRDVSIRFERYAGIRQFTEGFVTDMSTTEGTFTRSTPYDTSDVGPLVLRDYPTREHARSRSIRPSLTIRQAGADWALSSVTITANRMDHRMVRSAYR